MTVDEALPNVRKRLQRKARLIASYRDEYEELEELRRRGEDTDEAHKRRAHLSTLVERNTTQAMNDLRTDLEAIGRADLVECMTRYARKCLRSRDAYLQLNRLFLATDERTQA